MTSGYAFLRTAIQTRSRNHTATGTICYRFGLAGTSTFVGEDGAPRFFDYSRRTGIIATGWAAPPSTDESWSDPLTWAHRIEAVDKRKNSRQCRDDIVGIPIELVEASLAEQALQAYAERLAQLHNTVIMWSYHGPARGGKNHHGHVLYPGRHVEGLGFSRHRDREQDYVTDRAHPDRIDITVQHKAIWSGICRGYGIELRWSSETPGHHLGPKISGIKRQRLVGETSDGIRETIGASDTGEPIPGQRVLDEVAAIATGVTAGLTVREMLQVELQHARQGRPVPRAVAEPAGYVPRVLPPVVKRPQVMLPLEKTPKVLPPVSLLPPVLRPRRKAPEVWPPVRRAPEVLLPMEKMPVVLPPVSLLPPVLPPRRKVPEVWPPVRRAPEVLLPMEKMPVVLPPVSLLPPVLPPRRKAPEVWPPARRAPEVLLPMEKMPVVLPPVSLLPPVLPPRRKAPEVWPPVRRAPEVLLPMEKMPVVLPPVSLWPAVLPPRRKVPAVWPPVRSAPEVLPPVGGTSEVLLPLNRQPAVLPPVRMVPEIPLPLMKKRTPDPVVVVAELGDEKYPDETSPTWWAVRNQLFEVHETPHGQCAFAAADKLCSLAHRRDQFRVSVPPAADHGRIAQIAGWLRDCARGVLERLGLNGEPAPVRPASTQPSPSARTRRTSLGWDRG